MALTPCQHIYYAYILTSCQDSFGFILKLQITPIRISLSVVHLLLLPACSESHLHPFQDRRKQLISVGYSFIGHAFQFFIAVKKGRLLSAKCRK